MDAQRELLDSLMGKNRNEDRPEEIIHVRCVSSVCGQGTGMTPPGARLWVRGVLFGPCLAELPRSESVPARNVWLLSV